VAFLAVAAGLDAGAREAAGWRPFGVFRFAALAAGGRTAARAADV